MRNKLVLATVLLLVAFSSAVNVADCTNLSWYGASYTLTGDVVQGVPTSACFNITASGITLDCAGHSILLNGTGITVNSIANTTIENCVFPFYTPCLGCVSETPSINVTNATNVLITKSAGSCISLNEVDNATITYVNTSDKNCRLIGTSQYALSLRAVNNSNISYDRITSEQIGDIGVGNNYSLRIDNRSYSNRIFNSYFLSDWEIMNCPGGSQCGCLGGSDSNLYIHLENGSQANYFNTTRQVGTRVYSRGTEIGGNYYERKGCSAFGFPDAEGHSYLCTDANTDGFCDSPFTLQVGANTCSGTPAVSCDGTCLACDTIGYEYDNESGTGCAVQLGCTWDGFVCSGICTPCASINTSYCTNQTNCALPTPCIDNLIEADCLAEANCSWSSTFTSISDFLPYSDKYSIQGGGGPYNPTCSDGTAYNTCSVATPGMFCSAGGNLISSLSCMRPKEEKEEKTIFQTIASIWNVEQWFGVRISIWLLILGLVIILVDYTVIGKRKRVSLLSLFGLIVFIFSFLDVALWLAR